MEDTDHDESTQFEEGYVDITSQANEIFQVFEITMI